MKLDDPRKITRQPGLQHRSSFSPFDGIVLLFHRGAVPLMPGAMLSTAIFLGVDLKAAEATRQKKRMAHTHVPKSRSFRYK